MLDDNGIADDDPILRQLPDRAADREHTDSLGREFLDEVSFKQILVEGHEDVRLPQASCFQEHVVSAYLASCLF